MVRISMSFDVDCDTCPFHRVIAEETQAYTYAKDHEEAHPTHFVFITSR